jgi:hypothetical protein
MSSSHILKKMGNSINPTNVSAEEAFANLSPEHNSSRYPVQPPNVDVGSYDAWESLTSGESSDEDYTDEEDYEYHHHDDPDVSGQFTLVNDPFNSF